MSSNLTRGLQSSIDDIDIENGKLRFAIDTCRLFIDTENERLEISDIIRGLTSSEILNLNNPLPKLYLSSDTHELMEFDPLNRRWYSCSNISTNTIINSYEDRINTLENKISEYENILNEIKTKLNL